MESLPHWDLTEYFPGLDSEEFAQSRQAMKKAVADLQDLFDQSSVNGEGQTLVDEALLPVFERVLIYLNLVRDQVHEVRAYIHSFITTDSWDTTAQDHWSEFRPTLAQMEVLTNRFAAWVGTMDVEALIKASTLAEQHAYRLRKARVQARHLMSQESEALASELNLTGGGAWARFYGDFSSQIQVPFSLNGDEQILSMSAVRNLAYDHDRAKRKSAYEAELQAWEAAAMPIAYAINHVKGHVQTLTRRRGWGSAFDEALFANNVQRETIEAMFQAAEESFVDFRRYMDAKARILNVQKLTWFDLFAPVGAPGKSWSFEEAERFIVRHFGSFSARMQGLAQRAFNEHWIDAEPRVGKRDGAFCMRVVPGESRILTNFKPAFGGVSTLAHELGHAYHNLALAERTFLQRMLPMTMAETASIFCETIVREAALKEAGEEEQLNILEASLQSTCQVVVDISSRFRFERAVFAQRKRRELSIDELNQAMLDAQQSTYGDGLDPAYLHPYMWAVKSHYYMTTLSYYNFPYMFGKLFGLGLYAHYQEDPERFIHDYDRLLSSTGMSPVEELAEQFGMNVRTPAFWRSSLDVVRSEIDRFETLVESRKIIAG